MLSQPIESVGKSLFDAVYQLAKAKDEKALLKYMANGNSINVFYKNNRPIMACAKEGNIAAVELLLKLGANINNAVGGYAQGGYVKEVENLLSRGANINFAVRGYALNRYVTEVNHLLSRGAIIDYALFGYAFGNYIKETNDLLSRGANINFAIDGYLFSGNIAAVEKFMLGRNKDNIASGYAISGNVEEVNKLLTLGANINYASEAYAISGNVKEAEALFLCGANINDAIGGYAYGGHIKQVNNLLSRGASINCALSGYAQGAHVVEVEKLILSGANIDKAIKGYEMGGHFNNGGRILRILFFTKDLTVRDKLINGIKGLSLAELANIKKILDLAEKYQLSLEQAKSLMLPYTNELFLQVIPFLHSQKLPLDMLIAIAALVFEVPHSEVKDIFISHNNRIASLDKTTEVTKQKISYWNHFLLNGNKQEQKNNTTHETRCSNA